MPGQFPLLGFGVIDYGLKLRLVFGQIPPRPRFKNLDSLAAKVEEQRGQVRFKGEEPPSVTDQHAFAGAVARQL